MSPTMQFADMVSMLGRSVERFGSRPLFGERRGASFQWIRYAEFGALVDRARAGLASLEVERGERIAVISNNRVEWAACCYAAFGLGAVWVPMYEAQHDRDWQHILRNAGARICFVSTRAIRDRVAALKPELPALAQVISFEGEGEGTYAALLAAGVGRAVPAVAPDAGEIACFIYTSGTTGQPKGARLSHRNLAVEISALYSALGLHEEMEIRALSILPWAHVAGGICELHGTISLGGALGICRGPDELVRDLAAVQPTIFCGVPRIWSRVHDGVQRQIAARPPVVQALFRRALRAAKARRSGGALSLIDRGCLALADRLIFRRIVRGLGGRLRIAISGAAALSPEVGELIDSLGVSFFECYGMTETSGVVAATTPSARRIGSVGKPLPGFSIRLEPQADGEGGEVIIEGGGVMEGYHDLPDETRSAMAEGGGVRSGDLGRIDGDGFLFITGRVKEIYKLSNGKYVAPAPLEEALKLSAFIQQAMVYGADRPHNVALIVPDVAALRAWAPPGEAAWTTERLLEDERTRRLLEDEIAKHSNGFKGYERVRGFHLVAEDMSVENGLLTPTLKLRRERVARRYQAELDAMYG